MKLDNRGISLVQVIVTAALLSVAALVGIKMMRLQMKVAKTTALRFEVSYIMEEMVALLADPISCTSNFKGQNPKLQKYVINFIAQEIIDPATKQVVRLKWFENYNQSRKMYGQDLVKIVDYTLSDQGKDVDSSKGTTFLKVTFDRGKQALGGQLITKNIKLNIKTEDGKISSCRASRNPPRRVQANFTWKYDFSESHIFYNKGNVGIGGPASDTAALKVQGPIQILPSDETSCVANLEGSLRYDELSESLLFCNGNKKWKKLGASEINWSKPIQYILITNGNIVNIRKTGTHKKCFLSSVNKKGNVKCQITPENNRVWKFQAKANNGATQYRCVANCYN